MIGAGIGLTLAVLAQTPTPTPRDTQLLVALPADLNAAGSELLVRYALYGQHYFERTFGRRAMTAWSGDPRAAPRQLAQILQQSGLVQLLTDTPATDSTRFLAIYRFGDRALERGVEPLILAEMLAALDTSPYPRATFEGAWRLDSLASTLGPLRDSAFARIAADLDTRGGGVPIVVFNPAATVRSASVAVGFDSALRVLGRGTGELRAIDAARRATTTVRDGDSLRFVAREVPPVGVKGCWIRSGRGAAGEADTTAAGATALPLLARRVREQPGLSGHSWSFVTIEAANVGIGALKLGEHTSAKVLRLVERGGEAKAVTLTFGPRLARVRVANLLEDPLRTLALSPNGRSVALTLRPWDIITLLVEEAR